jgi:hypothetical protein
VGSAILLATALTASSALAAKPVVITGKYAGQASTEVNGDVVTISATGTGTATLLGAGKLTGAGSGDSSQQPCVPFGGTGKISGVAGTTISYKLLSGANGCGDEGGHVFSVKAKLQVVKATGKLAKATGVLTATGVYNRDDGSFSVKLSGTLKK